MDSAEHKRLRNLLNEAMDKHGVYLDKIADYLLKNGVLLAPMPMAEWLREELSEHIYNRCIEEL